jgi:hypothetical protein
MAKIKEIYGNDAYYPFIVYCENHGFIEMTDLPKCEFHKLQGESEISASLVSRIKTIYMMYCKQHVAEFRPIQKAKPKPSKSLVPDAEIEGELEVYFLSNADKLLHISDIAKAVGKKVKRSDILRILGCAPWCKAVDDTTFFYSS